jgi:hypothetical protein
MNGSRPLRDVRTRLLLIVVVALTLALGAATYGFTDIVGPIVAELPRYAFEPDSPSEYRIRREPREDYVSTVEAVVQALGELEGDRERFMPLLVRLETDAAARSLVGGPPRLVNVRDTDTRLYAAPIVVRGKRVGTLVAGLSMSPYEHTRRRALVYSITLFLVLLAIVGSSVWWLLRSALRPVALMTEQAAAWSEQDLDRRFGLGDPYDELTRLGATLDGLLDRSQRACGTSAGSRPALP